MAESSKTQGKLPVICNECGKEMIIPTADFYAERKGVKLTHSRYGGICNGTFRTVDRKRPQTHKKSRDKAIKHKQKG